MIAFWVHVPYAEKTHGVELVEVIVLLTTDLW